MDIETLIQELQRIQFAKENINTNVIDIALPTYSGGNNGLTLAVEPDIEAAEAAEELMQERMINYSEWIQEASGQIEYYNHEDFEGSYADYLPEEFNANSIADRSRNIETINDFLYRKGKEVDTRLIVDNYDEIVDFIYNNPKFRRYRGYHSMKGDLCSCSFSEQEEQVEGWTADKQLAFENAGYVVNDHDKDGFYAYYDLSSEGIALYMDYSGEELIELVETVKGGLTV